MVLSVEIKKSLIIFLFGLVAGTLISGFFAKKTAKPLDSDTALEAQEKLAECEAQKSQISEKLKNLDESSSGKSSDEVLAEMMKIFVADWGLRLKFKSAEAKCDLPKPLTVETDTKTSKQEIMSTAPSGGDQKNEKSPQKEEARIQRRAELNIIRSEREDEALRALEKVKVADLFGIYSSTTDVSVKDLQFLEGKFSGGFKPTNAKQKSIDIELELEIKKRTNPPEGNYSITEFSEGKQTSKGSGRGLFKGFSVLKGNQAIYIERAGGDNVMQLFYIPALESLIGNDYIKSSKSKLEYNGQVILRKNNY